MSVSLRILISVFSYISIIAAGLAYAEERRLLEGSSVFRDISLQTWQGLPRFGITDTQGLIGPDVIGRGQGAKAFRENESLTARVGADLERHNYSAGLLAQLDFMRVNQDCFVGMDKFEARVDACNGVVLQHSMQTAPWVGYIKNLALSLQPAKHTALFCQHSQGQGGCGNTSIRGYVKGPNNRNLPMDEFQQRDFFNTLKTQHMADFDRYWRQARWPQEAWLVEIINLSEYDFDEQQFVFRLAPARSLLNYRVPAPQATPRQREVAINSRAISLVANYVTKAPFEENFTGGRNIQVKLPMLPQQARALGQANPRRAFYAVTRIKFLPRPDIIGAQPLKDIHNVQFHYAENKVALYYDDALTRKIAEVPISDHVSSSATTQENSTSVAVGEGQRVFDGRAFSLLRIQQGPLLDSNLQQLTYSISSNERRVWRTYKQRQDNLARMQDLQSQSPNSINSNQLRSAQDRVQLKHLHWAAMNANQKAAFYQFALALDGAELTWPESFPSVSWGMNTATIFAKDHLSIEPGMDQVPPTESDKATVAKFINEVAATYPTDKLTLVYRLQDAQYNPQTQKLDFRRGWPLQNRQYASFDDERGQQFTGPAHPLVSASAKNRTTYHFMPSTASYGDLVPDPAPRSCQNNSARQSEDCVTTYQHFLQGNWGATTLALDREVNQPEIALAAERGTRLNTSRRGLGWRLVVELEDISMTLSPFQYTPRNKRETLDGEAQTIFASVQKAFVVAPNDEVVWQMDRKSLEVPPDGSSLTSESTSAPSWENTLDLVHGVPADRAIQDFMFARYYPERLNDRFLQAMFSSRWSYERSVAAPTGGRFFNPDARQPTWQDLQAHLPEFQNWLKERAAEMPSRLRVKLPLTYAYDTVKEGARCARWTMAKNSPLRNDGGARAVAAGKVRQCQTRQNQMNSEFQRCENLRAELSQAQNSLAKAERDGCKTTVENTTPTIEASGSCDFSAIEISQMQSAMQACLTERCGATPTTLEGIGEYQRCAQAVSTELQEQMRAAMLGQPRSSVAAKPTTLDRCEPHRMAIRNAEGGIRSFRCDEKTVAPTPMDCSTLAEVPKATHMHIEALTIAENDICGGHTAFSRRSKSSSLLLPRAKPYTETALELKLVFDEVKVPYDPPSAGATAYLLLDLIVEKADTSGRPHQMILVSKLVGSRVTGD